MCIFKNIFDFITNGAAVFSAASHGRFTYSSENIDMLKKELDESSAGPVADRRNLLRDRDKIHRDMSEAYKEYQALHKNE